MDGRFLSQDSAGYNTNNPVELDRYGYTANNPVNAFDPSGHELTWNASWLDKLLKAAPAILAVGVVMFLAVAIIILVLILIEECASDAATTPPPPNSNPPEQTPGSGGPEPTNPITKAGLPQDRGIRYIPPKNWDPSQKLPEGTLNGNKGYLDKFGNVWVKGPSRTQGQAFEWDVQVASPESDFAKMWSKDGTHVNVSMDGTVTHGIPGQR